MGESSVGDSGGGDGEHITHIGDMGVDIENRLRLALDAKVDEVGAQSDSSQIATNWNRYMYSRAYNKKRNLRFRVVAIPCTGLQLPIATGTGTALAIGIPNACRIRGRQ